MKLLFQSLYLSFSVFWRILIVLPVIILISFAMIFTLALLLPTMAPIAFVVSLTFASLVAIRAGYAARDEWEPPDFLRLLGAGIRFSFLQLAFYAILGGAVVLAVAAISRASLRKLGAAVQSRNPEEWWAFFNSEPAFAAIGIATGVLAVAFFAAILVPMAAAAAGANEKAPDYHLFWGFGASFAVLFVLSTGLNFVGVSSGAYEKAVDGAALASSLAVSQIFGTKMQPVPIGDFLAPIVNLVFLLWLMAWQFSAAALAFMARRDEMERAHEERLTRPQIDPSLLRHLRKSRE